MCVSAVRRSRTPVSRPAGACAPRASTRKFHGRILLFLAFPFIPGRGHLLAEWRENRMSPAQTRTSAATYPSKRRFSRRFEDCCIDHPSKHTQQAVGPTRTDPYPFLQRSPQPRPTLSAYPAVNCRRQCHRTAARSPETIRKKAPSARLRCKQSRLKLIIPLRSPTRSPVGVRTATRGIASVQP